MNARCPIVVVYPSLERNCQHTTSFPLSLHMQTPVIRFHTLLTSSFTVHCLHQACELLNILILPLPSPIPFTLFFTLSSPSSRYTQPKARQTYIFSPSCPLDDSRFTTRHAQKPAFVIVSLQVLPLWRYFYLIDIDIARLLLRFVSCP